MKKLTTFASIFALAALSANAAIDFSETLESSVDGKWFDASNWNNQQPPNDSYMGAYLQWSYEHMYLDDDATIGSLKLNRDIGARPVGAEEPTPTLSLYNPDTKTESTLTIDFSGRSDPSDGKVIYGAGNGQGFNAKVNSMNFVFDGGTINITDSSEGNTGTRTAKIFMAPETNEIDFTGKTYGYTFNSNVNSTEHLLLQGVYNDSSYKTGGVFKFVFNKTLTLKNGNDYKNLTVASTILSRKTDSAGNITDSGAYLHLGETATANIGKLIVGNNAFVQVDGVLNTNTTGNTFAKGSLTEINGTWNYIGSSVLSSANLTINGKANGVTGDRWIGVRDSSVLTINGKNKGDIAFLQGIRIFNGGTLVINSDSLDGGTIIWLPNENSSTRQVNNIILNASTSINSFRFGTNTETIITFADDAILTLTQFSSNNGDGWVHALTSGELLTLVNYENGKIRCTSDMLSDTLNDLNSIKAAGFEEGSFKWELGSDGTYWLVGTAAVPEPATVAAFFGLAALGFALYRRRR